MSLNGFRRLHPCVGTWITHLHRHGTPMAWLLQLGTRIKPAESGIFGTHQSQLLPWRVTSEPSDRSATHPMVGSWLWRSPLTLSTYLTWRVDSRRSKKSISLARYLGCLSVLIQNHFSLECGIVHMEACSSLDGAGTTRISILSFEPGYEPGYVRSLNK